MVSKTGGSFLDRDVPPTLISFAIAPLLEGELLTTDLKAVGHGVYLFAGKTPEQQTAGLICYADDEEEVFIGRDLAHAKNYSEGIASAIDVEVKRIIDESYDKAKSMIAEYRDVLDRCAALLLEKEKITRDEFEAHSLHTPLNFICVGLCR